MKLTIVTPSYNQGQFISDTLQSILRQELDFELEYLIFDAVSTDDTKEIVSKYSQKFKKKDIDFRFISEKDKGQSDAINKGWKVATGDIITYINSDDYYEPNALARVIRYFQANPEINWAYGGCNLVSENGHVYSTSKPKKYSKNQLLNYCNIPQPACFFRKKTLKQCGMMREDLHLGMDYDLWLRFAEKYPAGIMDFVVANMRHQSSGKTGSQSMASLKTVYALAKQHSTPYSWRRLSQSYYFMRGWLVTKFGLDITKRIEKSSKK
ncbi:MAG: glycosyltransferase family 2 protein [Patescibacteria group bacterium]